MSENPSTLSAIFGRMDTALDNINNIFTGWHRGVDPASGCHGTYQLCQDNMNYVWFIPDGSPKGFQGHKLIGSTIQKES